MNTEQYRVDSFMYGEDGKVTEHLKEHFEDIQDSVDKASLNRANGYVTWLLKHKWQGLYEPYVKLV